MKTRPRQRLATAIVVFLAGCLWVAAASAEVRHVEKTYNGKPFDYTIERDSDRDVYRVYRVAYPSPVVTSREANDTIPAEYYLPKNLSPGEPKRPAVICLHILDGNVELVRMLCSSLASRGVPAIWFKLPYYGERSLPGGTRALLDNPRVFLGALDQAVEDVRRTVDLLASRDEVDPQRIGVAGISLGGLLAATAAAEEPRLARVCSILAGGDLPTIIATANEARELKQFLAGLPDDQRRECHAAIASVDPLTHATKLRDRAQAGRVLMINGAEDEVIPKECAQKLADAMGIPDRVVWLEGLGHYTAMAALPDILTKTTAFFAEDLPEGVAVPPTPAASPTTIVSRLLADVHAMTYAEPAEGRCHLVDLEVDTKLPGGKSAGASIQWVRGHGSRFRLSVALRGPIDISAALGDDGAPWLASANNTVFRGTLGPVESPPTLDPQALVRLQAVAGAIGGAVLAPSLFDDVVAIQDDPARKNARIVRITSRRTASDWARLTLKPDGRSPDRVEYEVNGVRGSIAFRAWQVGAVAPERLFGPPAGASVSEVRRNDLQRMFASLLVFLDESLPGPAGHSPAPSAELRVVDRAPHGLLATRGGKSYLLVSGTPAQMGAAHGKLLAKKARVLTNRVLYVVGAGETIHSGRWFMDTMAEIATRAAPNVPSRFVEECDALSRAAGVSVRDGRYANLFPERFHCSGIAVRGKATRDGRVLHARVLDYMTDVNLQSCAVVAVFMPEGRNAWMSLGYAGFIGTVTAMNEKHLAVGEMGGRGEGDWDGLPMTLLLRDVMERASTVDEAVKIIRETPRTCEYYYVLSDKSRNMVGLHCTPEEVIVLRPGQQHPRLPFIPEDSIIVSGGDRAAGASRRIRAAYGRLDVEGMIKLVKRPVAMRSNLHNAVFSPETLDMWFADAGRSSPACDQPYAHCNLIKLVEFYRENQGSPPAR